ncbi:hypothetical protein [Mastigocoleus testarum]|uniref:Uncharacterized protein n=1 Tax=Mastigocoleus testarum BC008 TaxID=371196 RepID=A0A0V7ZPB0_9CYAN|nr:hypothetical protein [Mastigocoleus testarum]KST66517.1 hypothetical protein BC008_43085 [Mastigocoleus testarum BC008]
MNEADIPENENLTGSCNLENSQQLEKENCPFYSLLPNEDREIVSNKNLVIPKLPPANSSISAISNDQEWESSDWENEISSPESTTNIDDEEQTNIDSESSNGILELNRAQWESIPDLDLSEDELTSNSQKDWVAEPESEKQAAVNSEFQQLLELNQELRSANEDLYQQVEELTSALADNQKALQKQKNHSSIAESMLCQQTQESIADREKIESLFQELENSTQTIKRQESLIESYKSHLESSQQRLAQLERECTKLHSRYNEQSYKLSQLENASRELRTRLMRQQRQNLQFKAALSKCLDTPVPGDLEDNETISRARNFTRQSSTINSKLRSFLTNAQPIRPWSEQQADTFNDDEVAYAQEEDFGEPQTRMWQESINEFSGWDSTVKENIFTGNGSFIGHSQSEKIDCDDSAQAYIWDTSTEESSNFSVPHEADSEVSIWDVEASEEDISPQQTTTNFSSESIEQEFINEDIAKETIDRKITPETISYHESSDLDEYDDEYDLEKSDVEEDKSKESEFKESELKESDLKEKLDSVIETFFRSQGISQASQSADVDDAHNPQKTVSEPVVKSHDSKHPDDEFGNRKDSSGDTSLTDTFSGDIFSDGSTWSEGSFESDLNSEQFTHYNNDNSPSPVVYPERRRNPKKSLASVELPDFRSHSTSE